MIYLIQYDRGKGQLVHISEFSETERIRADEQRIELEVALNKQGVKDEVVILEAPSIEALKETHRRYFANLRELVMTSREANGLPK